MLDLDVLLLAPVYATWGRPATWRPVDGAPIPVRVLLRSADTVEPLGASSLHLGAATPVEVRAAEVAAPGEGDRIDLADGRVLIVQGAPVADLDRLVWRLDTRPARPGELDDVPDGALGGG